MGGDRPECGLALHQFCGIPTSDGLPVVDAARLAEGMEFSDEPKGAICGSFFLMTKACFTAVRHKKASDA